MAIIEVIDPPGELMYMVISRSGSMASSVSSWAMTSFAEASLSWTPRKMIRSSKSLLYGFISLIPYDVRSTKDGSTYLDDGYWVTFGFSLSASGGSAELTGGGRQEATVPAGVSRALLTTWSTKPYSLASRAVYQWSRSASLRILSRGWPVCRAVSSDSVFFT